MAVTKNSTPVTPRKMVFEPHWAEDGTFIGANVTMTAEASVAGLGRLDVGQVSYFRHASEMTPMEMSTYALLAETFDAKAVAELGCEKV